MRYDLDFQIYVVPYPDARKLGVLRGEMPVWGLLAALVALTAVGTWIRLYWRAQEPKLRTFGVRGLIWELTPLFFAVYQKEESPGDVDDLIKGPYCPKCQQSLQRESGGIDWVPRTRVIEHPCPICRFNHEWVGMGEEGRLFTVETAKRIVYREAAPSPLRRFKAVTTPDRTGLESMRRLGRRRLPCRFVDAFFRSRICTTVSYRLYPVAKVLYFLDRERRRGGEMADAEDLKS